MAGGPLQAADDMVRIIANGLTFGLADKGISKLTGKDEAALTAAARERAGIAGDIGNVLGYGGGAKVAWNGVKAVPKIAKAALSKKGAIAAGLGLGGLVEYNSRTGAGQAQAAPAKAAAKPAVVAKPRSHAYDDLGAPLAAVDQAPPTWDALAQQIAASQGGISLRQLGALGEFAQRTAVKPSRRTPANDAVSQKLQAYYDGLHEQEIASGVPQADADAAWAQRYSDLLKLDPYRPEPQYGEE